MSSLKNKSVDGVIWNLIEKFGVQFIQLILGIVLARILDPKDYGLIGMLTIFIAISTIFIDSGFGLAYIQKKNVTKQDASTIFYFNLIVSLLCFIILWFAAPFIANFYSENRLIDLLRVLSLILIINSFSLIQQSNLTRNVDFKKKTIISTISTLLSGLIAIIAAMNGYGVWSLVIQRLSKALIYGVGLWYLYTWRPSLDFKLSSLKSMLSFSTWALFLGVINTVFDNIYYVVIGKYFPAAQLGFYTKAKQFQATISQTPSFAVGSVAFPVFSKLQDDKIALKAALKKFTQHTMVFVVPLGMIFIIIAEPFFILLLTKKWAEMIPYFKLLVLTGVFYPMHMINVQALTAQGKMKLNFNISMLKNILRVLNILIMYKYSILYIIYGEIVLSIFALIINTYYTKKLVNYGFFEQIKDVFIFFLTAAILTLMGIFINQYISNDYLKIIIPILLVIPLYILCVYYFNREVYNTSLNIIKQKVSNR